MCAPASSAAVTGRAAPARPSSPTSLRSLTRSTPIEALHLRPPLRLLSFGVLPTARLRSRLASRRTWPLSAASIRVSAQLRRLAFGGVPLAPTVLRLAGSTAGGASVFLRSSVPDIPPTQRGAKRRPATASVSLVHAVSDSVVDVLVQLRVVWAPPAAAAVDASPPRWRRGSASLRVGVGGLPPSQPEHGGYSDGLTSQSHVAASAASLPALGPTTLTAQLSPRPT